MRGQKLHLRGIIDPERLDTLASSDGELGQSLQRLRCAQPRQEPTRKDSQERTNRKLQPIPDMLLWPKATDETISDTAKESHRRRSGDLPPRTCAGLATQSETRRPVPSARGEESPPEAGATPSP